MLTKLKQILLITILMKLLKPLQTQNSLFAFTQTTDQLSNYNVIKLIFISRNHLLQIFQLAISCVQHGRD